MKTALLLVSALSVSAQAAEFYQCEDSKGRKTFSDSPCSKDAVKKSMNKPAYSGSVTPDTASIKSIRNSNRVREIDRLIPEKYQQIRALKDKLNRELNTLRLKKKQAANNLAGATWEQSISTEMQAVTDQYNYKIKMRREDIERLNQERDSL